MIIASINTRIPDFIRKTAGRRSRLANDIPLLLAGLFLLLISGGCRLGYLMHAAAGQYRLIHGSIRVEEALKDENISPDVKKNLELVALIKDFGEKELGLKKTGNYETAYLNSRTEPIYIISASPKDRMTSVTWWFPVVGRIPYLGFFDAESASAMRKDLLEKNLDVYMGIADAYSTLGWFNDPVTLNLLEGKTVDLVETILHEMTHATIFFYGETEFNEGIANITGKIGAMDFLEKRYGLDNPLALEAKYILKDQRIFSSFLRSLMDKLERLYGSSLSYEEKLEEREQVFGMALERWETMKAGLSSDRFTDFGRGGLNNAYLLTTGLYHRHFLLFEHLLRERNGSIRELLSFVKTCSKDDLNNLLKQGPDGG
ncbi:MAG: aminopeptidase [Deltaproteobacteria bacterium]|nr:aminopeptidase [Deltaproteobacteria bacterium]